MKISFIGAGSLTFTRKVVSDILSVSAFNDIEISLMDIDSKNLDSVFSIIQSDIEYNQLDKIKLTKTTNRIESLRNANYIFVLARIGGLKAFTLDIEIPMKYGIYQCVGDTLCAGGILYGQRTIPFLLDLCKDAEAYAAKNVIMFNYMNPMAINTWAINKYSSVRILGLCHGVQHSHALLAEVLGVPKEELNFVCAGINHQTWFIDLNYKGKSLNDSLLDAFANNKEISNNEKVRVDILKRFGYFSTESNGHLSEYLAWYRKNPDEIENWISHSNWDSGESRGYLNLIQQRRESFDDQEEFTDKMKYCSENRSEEHSSYIIEALETGKIYRGNLNLVNNGSISNLPDDAIVEVPAYIDSNGISKVMVGDLPLGCAAICNQSINVQHLAMEAAVHGDRNLLKQAVLMDPLSGAVCTPPQIWEMVDELLEKEAQWLPQY